MSARRCEVRLQVRLCGVPDDERLSRMGDAIAQAVMGRLQVADRAIAATAGWPAWHKTVAAPDIRFGGAPLDDAMRARVAAAIRDGIARALTGAPLAPAGLAAGNQLALVQYQPTPSGKGRDAIGTATDALIRGLGLPPGGTRLAACAVGGMAEQMFRELASKKWGGEGKAALLLGHVAAMSREDYKQLAKGYLTGLLQGVASPVTDLFGLAVFVEKLNDMGREFAISAFTSKTDVSAELHAVLQSAKDTKDAVAKAWKEMRDDPTATVAALLSLPDRLNELAEQKAYQLGKQGGSAIVASLEAPWSGKKDEPDASPSLPLAWLESKAKAVESWFLDTPWSQIGAKIGYALGFVAIQIVLFAFTDGIGNAIEEVGAALGKLAGILGKLAKPLGAVVGRAAELVTAIGKGITLVGEAIDLVVGTLLKPVGKLLEPMLEPLSKFLKSLREFLRKLAGVTEKEGAQLLETAAAKTANTTEEVLAPKVAPHDTPPKASSAQPKTGTSARTSTGAGHEGDAAGSTAGAKKIAEPVDQTPAAKPKAGAREKAPAAADEPSLPSAQRSSTDKTPAGGEKNAPPSKKSTSKKKAAPADDAPKKPAPGSKKAAEPEAKTPAKKTSAKKTTAKPGASGKKAAGGQKPARKGPAKKTGSGKSAPSRRQRRAADAKKAIDQRIDDAELAVDPDDPLKNLSIHGNTEKLGYRQGREKWLNIAEPMTVGEEGVSEAVARARALDVDNRELLGATTNQRTQGRGVPFQGVPPPRAPISVTEDPSALLTRRFSEITEMRTIFDEAVSSIQNPNKLFPTELKKRINAKVWKIIRSGQSAEAARVREALDSIGAKYVNRRGFRLPLPR